MRIVYFISHPEVVVAPEKPVPAWSLSERGRQRMLTLVSTPLLHQVRWLFASTETKAVEAAEIIAKSRELVVRADSALGENDRSSTGFLPKEKFEAAADEFFAHPSISFHGWERAVDAQRRIVEAVRRNVALAPQDEVAIVSHGAVGTLFKCHLKDVPITRSEDQTSQGNYFCFDADRWQLIHDWRPIDDSSTPNDQGVAA